MAETEEIGAAAFLCSPHQVITGEVLVIDGYTSR